MALDITLSSSAALCRLGQLWKVTYPFKSPSFLIFKQGIISVLLCDSFKSISQVYYYITMKTIILWGF